VATTSSKPAPVLKKDIRKVLDRMQVQYRPTRGGFECLHLPSIEVSAAQGTSTDGANNQKIGPVATLRKKTSKLSFGKRRERDTDTASEGKDSGVPPRSPPSPLPASVKQSINRTNSSFFSLNSGTRNAILDPDTIGADHSDTEKVLAATPHTKGLPELPRSPNAFITGEVTDEVFEATGANERSVRFEVNIVKVRFLHWHADAQFLTNVLGSVTTTTRYTL
jgi:serine/threonine protein kinase KIN1/2